MEKGRRKLIEFHDRLERVAERVENNALEAEKNSQELEALRIDFGLWLEKDKK